MYMYGANCTTTTHVHVLNFVYFIASSYMYLQYVPVLHSCNHIAHLHVQFEHYINSRWRFDLFHCTLCWSRVDLAL